MTGPRYTTGRKAADVAVIILLGALTLAFFGLAVTVLAIEAAIAWRLPPL